MRRTSSTPGRMSQAIRFLLQGRRLRCQESLGSMERRAQAIFVRSRKRKKTGLAACAPPLGKRIE